MRPAEKSIIRQIFIVHSLVRPHIRGVFFLSENENTEIKHSHTYVYVCMFSVEITLQGNLWPSVHSNEQHSCCGMHEFFDG